MKFKTLALLILSLFAFAAMAQDADASAYSNQPDNQRLLLTQKHEITLDKAAAKVRKETGGRVLSARSQNRNGRTIHRIKVLMPSGHVKIVRVDAATGEMD